MYVRVYLCVCVFMSRHVTHNTYTHTHASHYNNRHNQVALALSDWRAAHVDDPLREVARMCSNYESGDVWVWVCMWLVCAATMNQVVCVRGWGVYMWVVWMACMGVYVGGVRVYNAFLCTICFSQIYNMFLTHHIPTILPTTTPSTGDAGSSLQDMAWHHCHVCKDDTGVLAPCNFCQRCYQYVLVCIGVYQCVLVLYWCIELSLHLHCFICTPVLSPLVCSIPPTFLFFLYTSTPAHLHTCTPAHPHNNSTVCMDPPALSHLDPPTDLWVCPSCKGLNKFTVV